MYPKVYGNPDFVLHKEKITIFCDGDFWHATGTLRKKAFIKILEEQN